MDKQTITGNGGTSYTLDHAVANVNEIEVFVNNVRQEPSVAYTVSGTALTMTGDVEASDDFYVVFQGKAVQTVVPPSSSVTTDMVVDGAVTANKIGFYNTSASDPAATSNKAVGDLWVNTTSGEMYVCTNATVNDNIWLNVGTGDAGINAPYSIDYLVVAGGGAGGGPSSYNNGAGGGGAGGYRNSYNNETSGGGGSSETSLSLKAGKTITVTVGAGGTGNEPGQGSDGGNSSIAASGITTITSIGGGGGGYEGGSGGHARDGGSGGGGAGASGRDAGEEGLGTANQGFNGGLSTVGSGASGGGGGGGASEVGQNGTGSKAGDGGDGLASLISGTSVTRAGGGAGGVYNNGQGSAGAAGAGGGGSGVTGNSHGNNGTANTGGGGSGGSAYNGTARGGAGGSGVVILRMPTSKYSGTTTGSPTVSTNGNDTILVFNSSGTYTS